MTSTHGIRCWESTTKILVNCAFIVLLGLNISYRHAHCVHLWNYQSGFIALQSTILVMGIVYLSARALTIDSEYLLQVYLIYNYGLSIVCLLQLALNITGMVWMTSPATRLCVHGETNFNLLILADLGVTFIFIFMQLGFLMCLYFDPVEDKYRFDGYTPSMRKEMPPPPPNHQQDYQNYQNYQNYHGNHGNHGNYGNFQKSKIDEASQPLMYDVDQKHNSDVEQPHLPHPHGLPPHQQGYGDPYPSHSLPNHHQQQQQQQQHQTM